MTTRKWIVMRYFLPVYGHIASAEVFETLGGWRVVFNSFDIDGNFVHDYDAIDEVFLSADDAMRAAEAWLESQEVQR